MSSTTDQITSLLKRGVMSLTIGHTPEGVLFIQAAQAVYTGSQGNQMAVQHQAAAETISDCLNQISKQVDHALVLGVEHGKILTMPKRN